MNFVLLLSWLWDVKNSWNAYQVEKCHVTSQETRHVHFEFAFIRHIEVDSPRFRSGQQKNSWSTHFEVIRFSKATGRPFFPLLFYFNMFYAIICLWLVTHCCVATEFNELLSQSLLMPRMDMKFNRANTVLKKILPPKRSRSSFSHDMQQNSTLLHLYSV